MLGEGGGASWALDDSLLMMLARSGLDERGNASADHETPFLLARETGTPSRTADGGLLQGQGQA